MALQILICLHFLCTLSPHPFSPSSRFPWGCKIKFCKYWNPFEVIFLLCYTLLASQPNYSLQFGAPCVKENMCGRNEDGSQKTIVIRAVKPKEGKRREPQGCCKYGEELLCIFIVQEVTDWNFSQEDSDIKEDYSSKSRNVLRFFFHQGWIQTQRQ